jgi:probable F420-dependent oxidoreductase
MSARPFRFGVFGETARSRDALLDTARKAEERATPLASLALVASVTRTLRVGSLVFSNDYRHPAILAKEVATLDVLSSGRVELGLGAGFSRAEYEQVGMRFDEPAVRVDRLQEAIRVVKGLFASEPFTFHGKHYTFSGFDSFPKPAQRPHPPILMGVAGKRMLSIAAREADIIGLQTTSTVGGTLSNDPSVRLARTVAEKIDHVRRVAGDRFDRIELSMVATIVVTDRRRPAAEQFARDRQWSGIPVDQILEMPSLFIGSPDEIAEQMQARRERYGLSYYVIFDHSLEWAAPVVARLAGK